MLFRSGDIMRELGHNVQAAKIHRELTVRDIRSPEIRTRILRSLITDYFAARQYQAAFPYIDKLLEINRNDHWALTKRLELYEAIGDWRNAFEAERKLQSVTKVRDNEKLALLKVQEGHKIVVEGGKEHDARLQYRAAIKLDPKNAPAYLALADSYIQDNRPQDALKEWSNFFDANPRLAHLAFDRMEETVFELGRFQEVERIYRKLVRENPDNARAVVALARFLYRKGETEEAIQVCEEGLEHSPNSIWIRRNLFRFLAEEGKHERAVNLGLEILDLVMKEREAFTCAECDDASEDPHWRCPECQRGRSYNI